MLNIFAFQRAFTATNNMALAVDEHYEALKAIEEADILDCLHLGLLCETTSTSSEYTSPAVAQFIDYCPTILSALAHHTDQTILTIVLSHHTSIQLVENGQHLLLKMDGKQVILPQLTFKTLRMRLVQDIEHHPNLYTTLLNPSNRTPTFSELAFI